MNSERIIEIHKQTAYPESLSVYTALLQVWNECQQENNVIIEQLKAERSAAIVEVCRLRDEVLNAKCEGWEDGFKMGGINYSNQEAGIDTIISNPHK